MNTQEKLNYFTSNMSLPFFLKNYVKLELLDKDIRRYIKRELKGEKNLQFTSQDLRSYVLALEKVHKVLNKKISFTEFNKHLEKEMMLKMLLTIGKKILLRDKFDKKSTANRDR